jgi:magnesium transporter
MIKKEHPICDQIEWIDVSDPSTPEMQEIADRYRLNPYIVRDCMEPDHLPKYDLVDDVHFLILRYYSHNFNQQAATIQDLTNKVAIFYTDEFLLTIHKSEVAFMEIVNKRHVVTGRCTSVSEVVIRIIWQALESYDDPVQRLSEQIDFHENNIMVRRMSNDQLEALYYIKRQASLAHKTLMLMQEPINHVRTTPENDAALQDVKDQHLKMLTLYNQAVDDVNNLMNMYMSFSAQRTNDVMKVLTMFSAFFLPLSFIVGIYGMNFEYMPELGQRWGYPAVITFMVVVIVVIYSWFRRKKWL